MIVLLILLIILLLLAAAGYIAFYRAVVRLPPSRKTPGARYFRSGRGKLHADPDWLPARNPERVSIRSQDGLKLYADLIPAENAKGTVLFVPGYRTNGNAKISVICPFYHSLGWNILAVCQRATGDSEGKYLTFGVLERFDVRDWAVFLADRFGPEHPIVLSGISMGSTTVLMSLGTELPENVRGVVADCGFTSPRDELTHTMRYCSHLPVHPLLDIADCYAKLFAGFGFSDYSTVAALQQTDIPVLFIHGEADTFVPIRFTVENYAACKSEKELLTVPEAGHGESYPLAPEKYQRTIRKFLDGLIGA